MQGHIHRRVYVRKDGRESVRWYVVVDVGRDLSGRRRQQWHGGFTTRREAEATRARVVHQIMQKRYTPRSSMTLEQWVQGRWLPMMETRVKPTTLHGYRQIMEGHVLPRLGSKPIQELRPFDLDGLYAQMTKGEGFDRPLSPATVANVHRAVHKALADAVDAGLLADNPASRAKAPRPWRTRTATVDSWTAAELSVFLEAVSDDRLVAVWRLIALTGMRRGEALGLRWRDVDLERRWIYVRRSLVDVNYTVIESTPKNNSARTVDIDEGTVQALRRHRERQLAERQLYGQDYEDNDLVVALENGAIVHPTSLSQMFGSHLAQTGLRRIRLHDLRHTHATLALQSGVPVHVVSARLGHASPAFTLQQYSHVLPGMQAAAAGAVAELLDRRDS